MLTERQVVTIPLSGTLSPGINLRNFELVGIQVPVLTSCNLFLHGGVAADRGGTEPGSANYTRLFDAAGAASYTIAAGPGSLSLAPSVIIGGFHWTRLETSVVQAAARDFTIALKKYVR